MKKNNNNLKFLMKKKIEDNFNELKSLIISQKANIKTFQDLQSFLYESVGIVMISCSSTLKDSIDSMFSKGEDTQNITLLSSNAILFFQKINVPSFGHYCGSSHSISFPFDLKISLKVARPKYGNNIWTNYKIEIEDIKFSKLYHIDDYSKYIDDFDILVKKILKDSNVAYLSENEMTPCSYWEGDCYDK